MADPPHGGQGSGGAKCDVCDGSALQTEERLPMWRKRLPNVAAEMALHLLAYNLTRGMNIVGRQHLLAAIGTA
jgi:hypothetical protein